MPPTLGDRNLNVFAETHGSQQVTGKGGAEGVGMPKSASDPTLTQSQLQRKQNQARDSMAVLPSASEGVFATSGRAPSMGGTARPVARKSILKVAPLPTYNSDDTLNHTADFTGQFARASAVYQSMHDRGEHTVSFAPRRSVSFAPNAHVRMFENIPNKPKRRASTASFASSSSANPTLNQPRGQSRGSHSRRQSITNMSAIASARSSTSGPAGSEGDNEEHVGVSMARVKTPRSSLAALIPDRFIGEGESVGEDDMEESDIEVEGDGDGSAAMDMSLQQVTPRLPFTLGARTSTGARLSLSRPSLSKEKVSPPEATNAGAGQEGDETLDEHNGDGSAMDITTVVGGIIRRPSLAVGNAQDDGEQPMDLTSISNHAPHLEGDADTTIDSNASSDMSGVSGASAEDRTMDFTIAIGGIMPNSLPSNASRSSRVSLGYSNPGDSAAHERLVPGQPMDGEEGMDMEETAVYGGVLPRIELEGIEEGDTMSSDGSLEQAGERERTMTYNFGKEQIQLPPVDAEDGDGEVAMDIEEEEDEDEDDGEQAMDMTEALGGVLARPSMGNARRSLAGRKSYTSNHTAGSTSLVNSTSRNVFAPVSPAYPSNSGPGTPGRQHTSTEASATPSFARPTVSSAKKSRVSLSASMSGHGFESQAIAPNAGTRVVEKRNVFAPSPSPSPSKTNAVATRATAAQDVAKRLSFAPTPSGTTSPLKRKGEDVNFSSTPSKRRSISAAPGPVAVANVFAPAASPRKPLSAPSATAPRRSVLGPSSSSGNGNTITTPNKSLAAHLYLASTGQSPAQSPVLRKMLGAAPSPGPVGQARSRLSVSTRLAQTEYETAPEREHEKVQEQQQEEGAEAFEPPTIPLSAFLDMAGVGFMDDLGIANVGQGPRRSSRAGGRRQSWGGDKDFALHEYTAASVQNCFVHMYQWASSTMKRDILATAADLQATEDDCSKHNPPVIRDYLSASDEDRPLFEMTFKGFKAITQLKAKARWYGWRIDLMQRLKPDVEAVWEGMKEDTARLDQMQEQTAELLPELEAKLASLQEELVKEREAVKEIEACDVDELNDLRAAIADQDGHFKSMQAEVAETVSTLSRLEANLAELNLSKAGHDSAIATARGLCDQYTKSDVLRLRDELNAVQAMHGWVVESVEKERMKVVYGGELVLRVPLGEGQVEVEYRKGGNGNTVGKADKVDKVDGAMNGLREVFMGAVGALDVQSLGVATYIQQAGQLYSTIRRIRAELRLMDVHYPTTTAVRYTTANSSQAAQAVFEARASIMYPELKSRVEVVFTYDAEALLGWPESVGGGVRVERIYGAADPETLTAVACETIGVAHAEGYHGYLVQTCLAVAGA